MGHMRIGFLPHSKQWNNIVDQLSIYGGDPVSVRQIADLTLSAIQNNFKKLSNDDSIIKSIKFLVILSYSANQTEQLKFLDQNGISIGDKMTLFSLLSSAKQYITTDTGSLEMNKMALDSAMQAIISFQENHESRQLLLSGEVEDIWHSAGTGSAFCEMARSFVAEFTDRQLRYFIEREAARSINDFGLLNTFSETLSKQTAAISNHALEISKLMQSFSAGWFNRHSMSALPTNEELKSFIDYSFHKMREEFRREADEQ